MLQFILRRLGLVIPTFIGITLLTFAFVHMIPGDPVMIMAGERGISPERHAQLLAELGLDKPMWQQYLHYIWGVMHGDLGISMKSRIPVWEEFVPRFQATLELGVCAMIFATAVGIPVGVLAAVKRGAVCPFRAELRELFQGVQADAHAGDILGKDSCHGGTLHAPVKHKDTDQIQDHVQDG